MRYTELTSPKIGTIVVTGIREDWFPTSVWYFDIEDCQDLNQRLLVAIEAERKKDSMGMGDRSTVLGWHSRDMLHHSEAFKDFVSYAIANVLEVAQFNRWILSKVKLNLLNCWANINGKFAYNVVHNHPQSILSGVYYVQTPENCGNIFFKDPRDVAVMMAPPVDEYTVWTFQKIVYQPKAGRMLIFPSWLLHGVEPNLSDEERVCLSFNVG